MANYFVHSSKCTRHWIFSAARIPHYSSNQHPRLSPKRCLLLADNISIMTGTHACSKPIFISSCCTFTNATRNIHSTNFSLPSIITARSFCTDTSSSSECYREHYIPITRYSVIQHLMHNGNLLQADVHEEFVEFSLALDNVIVTKYQGVLQDIKRLFDPINPDKDTIQTRNLSEEERIDKEELVIQHLDTLLKKANFHKLSDKLVEKSLMESPIKGGLRIQVDPRKYEILHFWALGLNTVVPKKNWYNRMWEIFPKSSIPHPDYYRRLIVALRRKGETKLVLKGFKDMPTDALEMLLPDCRIKLNHLDKGIITASISIAITGVVAKTLTTLVELNFQWSFVTALILCLIAIRIWTVYKNRKNSYLVKLSQMLYYKNLANNRSLLTLLVDRAEDESFKEAMLIYTFLHAKQRKETSNLELDGKSNKTLEQEIEKWLFSVTGTKIEFDARGAIALLKSFDILHCVNNQLVVQPLKLATNTLYKNFTPNKTFRDNSLKINIS
ncbi:transmembrane protein 143 isoform X1 [Octopus sinensis]|uniref:Transmembrane protein 143 isoform X1 n=2 Tax=Octopus sinensis TaxID=2607531 RepID=A0A6P7T9A7_9MOLL|nr:transmembrane protein 143 isoform X1 [Octopus sinensis]